MESLLYLGIVILIFVAFRHSKRINELLAKQHELSSEIQRFHDFLNPKTKSTDTEESVVVYEKSPTTFKEIVENVKAEKAPDPKPVSVSEPVEKQEKTATLASKSAIEKFIGENLINKIGIAITVIGVAIGVKYSIDNELISPLTRIILGYLAGLALLGIGLKLKAKYSSFSAVLVSGAMAIMYFITFAAYSYYELIPQGFTFALMVLFTAFTALAALSYNTQVIAHIGLVGAYGVPFLLSNDSGNVAGLFTYMTIINIGIMVIAFKKYWKPLYYTSFGLTWIIYFSWQFWKYEDAIHFNTALLFLPIFFLLFYTLLLGFKLTKKETFNISDVSLLLMNSFLFYGSGVALLNGHEGGTQLLGLFTLANAVLHFLVSAFIYRQKLADKNLFYLIAGLVLVFITLAIPVQLDGNWVTVLWAAEAALLFWIGRTKQVAVYEALSYPLMILAVVSLFQDWELAYQSYAQFNTSARVTPLLNVYFLTSLLVIATFGFINFIQQKKTYSLPSFHTVGSTTFLSFALPAVFVLLLYGSLRMEIASYWDQRYQDSAVEARYEDVDTQSWEEQPQTAPIESAESSEIEDVENSEYDYAEETYTEETNPDNTYAESDYEKNEGTYWSYDYDLLNLKIVWILNYSLFFFSILGFVCLKKFKSEPIIYATLVLSALTLVAFLTQGLYSLSELRESYLASTELPKDAIYLSLRYISFLFVAIGLVVSFMEVKLSFTIPNVRVAYDFLLHTSILWIASSELIHWLDLADSSQTYKLGLSILWGVYALFIIGLGIGRKKKHLRLGGIGLFAITLAKLFLYDIQDLSAVAKTIAFVSLGVLLLIISFLYTKYKHLIVDENEE